MPWFRYCEVLGSCPQWEVRKRGGREGVQSHTFHLSTTRVSVGRGGGGRRREGGVGEGEEGEEEGGGGMDILRVTFYLWLLNWVT